MPFSNRRSFVLRAASASAAFFTVPGLFAEELTRTPAQTDGPFYPDRLPLDTDNDLLVVNDGITPAIGQITYLTGRVLDLNGAPIRNAAVEIWQCDANGAYLHSRSGNKDKQDRNFQGFGRFTTGSAGTYSFRTIKPVPYPGRTPHIHFKVKRSGKELLTTQCYVQGEARNERDFIYRSLRDAASRDALLVAFKPLPGSRLGELTANFDIVLGRTPEG